ncbi:MAG: hypothetical protein PHR40_03495 [Bacteroidales bacterium]|nr:hypothetical protein [Bacteroidales bacterium]
MRKITTIILPESITAIRAYAFYSCSNITAFQFLNATPITYESKMLKSGKPVKVPTAAE